MRRLLKACLCVAVVASLALTGAEMQPEAQAQGPQRGGTLRVAQSVEPQGLDPTTNTAAAVDRIQYNNVYEGLVKLDRDGDIVPALAESWDFSEDGLVWTFNLVQGAKFHDGSDFTAEDVIFTIERNQTLETIVHPEFYETIAEMEALDDHTVRFTLSEFDSLFLFNLARGDSAMLSSTYEGDLNETPNGTGPFRFVERVPGDRVVLERFEDYHNPELPYLDGVEFNFVPDPTAAFAALQAGDVDVLERSNVENAPVAEGDPRFKVFNGASTGEVTLSLNNARPPFDDVRVRRAVAYALDRQEIIDIAQFGFGVPVGSHMSPLNENYVDLTWRYSQNFERARALLEEAGHGGGLDVVMKIPSNLQYAVNSAQVIQQMLAEVGINADIELVEFPGQWLEQVFNAPNEYQMSIIAHVEEFDIEIYSNPAYYFRYDSETFREVLRRARSEPDPTTRKQLYGIAQFLIADEVATFPLYELSNALILDARVEGWWEDEPLPNADATEAWINN